MYYRVVIKRFDHRGKRIVELGPWLSRHQAEAWAGILREMGYYVAVENMKGDIVSGMPRIRDDD